MIHERSDTATRRHVLTGVLASIVAGIAGCAGGPLTGGGSSPDSPRDFLAAPSESVPAAATTPYDATFSVPSRADEHRSTLGDVYTALRLEGSPPGTSFEDLDLLVSAGDLTAAVGSTIEPGAIRSAADAKQRQVETYRDYDLWTDTGLRPAAAGVANGVFLTYTGYGDLDSLLAATKATIDTLEGDHPSHASADETVGRIYDAIDTSLLSSVEHGTVPLPDGVSTLGQSLAIAGDDRLRQVVAYPDAEGVSTDDVIAHVSEGVLKFTAAANVDRSDGLVTLTETVAVGDLESSSQY
jgi:hypothetical protein